MSVRWSEDPAVFASPAWARLVGGDPAATVFHTPRYLKLYWEEFGGGLQVAMVPGGDEPAAVCAFDLRDGRLRFLGGTEVTDYMGPVGLPADRGRAAKELMAALGGRTDWEEADLGGLPDDTPWLPALAAGARDTGLEAAVEESALAPYLPLPGSFEEYLAGLGGKRRHEIRRKARRLEEALPGARLVDAAGAPDPEDLERFLDWHRSSPGEKGRFMQPGMELFFRRLAGVILPAGVLRLVFLEQGGRKLAGAIGFRWRRRLLLYNSAYDQRFAAVSPGMVLVAKLIRDLIATGHEGLDMLKGDLDYKHRFGARPRTVRRLVLTRR